MNANQEVPPDANMLISPAEPTQGALGVFAKHEKTAEVKELEQERQTRIWEVRAIISDTIPLSGDADTILNRSINHLFFLNESPLWIYLHSGGANAVYYELVAGHDRHLRYIAVRVESRLPSNALLMARKPINALLDVFTRDSDMPLLIQRLELISPRDGSVLLTQTLVPNRNGVRLARIMHEGVTVSKSWGGKWMVVQELGWLGKGIAASWVLSVQ